MPYPTHHWGSCGGWSTSNILLRPDTAGGIQEIIVILAQMTDETPPRGGGSRAERRHRWGRRRHHWRPSVPSTLAPPGARVGLDIPTREEGPRPSELVKHALNDAERVPGFNSTSPQLGMSPRPVVGGSSESESESDHHTTRGVQG
jgi:hypothetical protein